MNPYIDSALNLIIGIVTLLLIVPLFLTILDHINTQFQNVYCENYINLVNEYEKKIKELSSEIHRRNLEIKKLSDMITSINETNIEKDLLIQNLTTELNKTKLDLEKLKEMLEYYQERKYITEIHNYFYNISNYFSSIENKISQLNFNLNFLFSFSIISSAISITLIILKVKPNISSKNLDHKSDKNESYNENKHDA